MKVCMLTTSFPRYKQDFAGAFVYQLAREVVKRNIQVTVIAPHDAKAKGFEVWDGLKVYRFRYMFPCRYQRVAYHAGIPENLRRSWLARLQVLPFVLAFMSKAASLVSGCDIIHAHWIPTGMIGVVLGRMFHKPVVLTVHRLVSSQSLTTGISRCVLNQVDYICFNSSYTMGVACELTSPKTWSILPPSVDPTRFSLTKGAETALQRFGIPQSRNIVLFLGRLVEKKGVRYLLEAVPQVLEQVNISLIIAGAGPEEVPLRGLANDLGISEWVHFMGHIPTDQVPALLQAADVFVLPSIVDSKGETEALGVVLLEALATGVPCVASNVGGIVDIIDDEVNGYLVEQKNAEQLADRIVGLLKNESLRKRMGENGRRKVEEKFASDRAAEETMAIYERLLGEQI